VSPEEYKAIREKLALSQGGTIKSTHDCPPYRSAITLDCRRAVIGCDALLCLFVWPTRNTS
jgi:hypothetical protein